MVTGRSEPRRTRAESPTVRAARLAAGRTAGLVERLSSELRHKLLGDGAVAGDGAAHGDGLKYSGLWVPADQRSARLAIYNSEDEVNFEEGGRRDAARLAPFISPDSVVVDFGCGTGRIARYVAPLCAELWAVDVSPAMLALAAERLAGSTNVRFARCADVTIPDVETESVDLVYSFLVLQHLEREDAFLAMRELRRVLRPGGAAVLTFPNLLSDSYLDGFVHYALTGEVTNQARARVYTPQEVERLLPAAGFSVTELEAGTDIVATCAPAV